MKRIVWVGVTILIMICIMGFGLHTLNHIDDVNQARREKERGEDIAYQIVMTTATTSIWERLRATTEMPQNELPQADASAEGSLSEGAQEVGDMPSTMPVQEEEQPVVPDVDTAPAPQTNTVTNHFVINGN